MRTLITAIAILLGLATLASAQAVDLLWSANTYTPPFYRGHTRATAGSQVKVAALVIWPGKVSGNLNFSWQKDGQALLKSSGQGKNVLTFNAGTVGEITKVAVIVSDNFGVKKQQAIDIAITNPLVIVYQDDALLGVNYGRAVGDILALSQPEINLLAEPYFFTATDVRDQKITYDWKLNDQKVVPNAADNRLVTFAAPSGTAGENTVTLALKNLNNVFQDARREFKIKFGAGTDFNF